MRYNLRLTFSFYTENVIRNIKNYTIFIVIFTSNKRIHYSSIRKIKYNIKVYNLFTLT